MAARWTFVDFGQASSGQGLAGVSFLLVEAAGGYKAVARAYFRGRGAWAQYGPKVMLGAKTLNRKGDAYRSNNM